MLDLPQDLKNTKEQVIFTNLNQELNIKLNSANLLGMPTHQRCPSIKKTECNRTRMGEVSAKNRLKEVDWHLKMQYQTKALQTAFLESICERTRLNH